MTIPVYHKSHADNELADFYMVHGVQPYAQINVEAVSRTGAPGSGQLAVFDERVWAEKRYTPHRPADEGKGYIMAGIPPGFTGMIMLDLEDDFRGDTVRTGWKDVRRKDDDWDHIPGGAQAYLNLMEQTIAACRRDFPDCLLTVWDEFAAPKGDNWTHRRAVQGYIASLVDGNSPACYLAQKDIDADPAKAIEGAVLNVRKSLAWKKHLIEMEKRSVRGMPCPSGHRRHFIPVWRVYPSCWKLAMRPKQDGGPVVMDLDVARALIRAVLDAEVDGVGIDGLCIFDTPPSETATHADSLAFAKVVVEEVSRA